jgi:endoglycosylceramidase
VQRVVDEADASMMPWTAWTYWNGGTSQSLILDPTKPPTPDNISQDKLDIFARPYPQAIAGTPQGFGYDRSARKFTMTYSTQRAGGGSFQPGQLTQIFVGLRHFPAGYAVQIGGADVTSAGCADYLALRNHSDATSVTVNVVPGPCGQVTQLPPAVPEAQQPALLIVTGGLAMLGGLGLLGRRRRRTIA